MKKKETIGILQFGCAKNLVDMELMLGLLVKNGYSYSLDPDDEKIKTVIINTCSFIADAEKESVSAILNMIQKGKRIILTGCLPQKHPIELPKLLPEIKNFIGTCEYDKIIEAIENKEYYNISNEPNYTYCEEVKREQITVGSSSYIKIAEGCYYNCGYCVIPKLRGKYKSRKMENIINEAKELANKGVSEVILIAQDTTSYGLDLYKKPMLATLLTELNKIENLNWIRIMYAYPTNFDEELMNTINNLDKVVKYIDIPLQHSHTEVLKRMKRPAIDYRKFIKNLRKKIKNVAIRTTFIVGYPGETEEEYQDLYEFIKEMKFDKAGVFEYSREKNTYAYSLKPQIKANIKKKRRNALMKLQKEISSQINKNCHNKTIQCIIEEIHSDGKIVARSYKDAPEVDGLVYIKSNEYLTPGDIVNVKITKSTSYDMYGIV
ncbi:MAG: 30S ribosomal protein S12 methylthiotransferase RimO [Candidatus Gastranaerophilales bacterium]|nr:30S ribosomal protein S12 methylthiotransferase RimO [Candidatus Gastranaerophilales bacterium]